MNCFHSRKSKGKFIMFLLIQMEFHYKKNIFKEVLRNQKKNYFMKTNKKFKKKLIKLKMQQHLPFMLQNTILNKDMFSQ